MFGVSADEARSVGPESGFAEQFKQVLWWNVESCGVDCVVGKL